MKDSVHLHKLCTSKCEHLLQGLPQRIIKLLRTTETNLMVLPAYTISLTIILFYVHTFPSSTHSSLVVSSSIAKSEMKVCLQHGHSSLNSSKLSAVGLFGIVWYLVAFRPTVMSHLTIQFLWKTCVHSEFDDHDTVCPISYSPRQTAQKCGTFRLSYNRSHTSAH